MIELNDKKEIVSCVIDELNKRGFLKKTDDLKEKTKELLKNIPRLDGSIKHYEKEIKRLNDSKNSSTGGPKFSRSQLTLEVKSTADSSSLDVIESRIKQLQMTIEKIKSFKIMVDEIMYDKLSVEDVNILKKVYWEKVDADDIAIDLDCDKSTVYRRIAKAIEDIKIELFASDFIDLMM